MWAKWYKQQQNIDTLSGKDATSGFFCDEQSSLTQNESSYSPKMFHITRKL